MRTATFLATDKAPTSAAVSFAAEVVDPNVPSSDSEYEVYEFCHDDGSQDLGVLRTKAGEETVLEPDDPIIIVDFHSRLDNGLAIDFDSALAEAVAAAKGKQQNLPQVLLSASHSMGSYCSETYGATTL